MTVDAIALSYRCGHPRTPDNTVSKGRANSACRACVAARSRRWYAANRERARANQRRHYERTKPAYMERARLRRLADPARQLAYQDRAKYGVTRQELAQVCEICGSTWRLAIDHDHETGRVRGRLCQRCNNGLGFFGDDPERIEAALRYLRAR